MTLTEVFSLRQAGRIRHKYGECGEPDRWIASDGTEFICTEENYLHKLVECAEYELNHD